MSSEDIAQDVVTPEQVKHICGEYSETCTNAPFWIQLIQVFLLISMDIGSGHLVSRNKILAPDIFRGTLNIAKLSEEKENQAENLSSKTKFIF